ncbi:MAG: efflux RND transporter permease subunit [Spirochaetaceae bacterium]|nr:MAG: efflux RND transporter permease subunit [Spirochaetaceae bacterium]
MLVKTVVNRPTTFFVIFALLTAFGIYTITDLSVDLFPEIDPPVLVVITNYDGADPQEVERSVTRPLESVLSNVSSINSLTSTTRQGNSQIVLEFTWGTNMDEASNELRDRLDMARGILPDDAGSPSIFKFDPSLIPILELRMIGERSPDELREIALTRVQPRLEQIDGIAQANVTGGRDRVIRVDIPRSRLDALGLTFSQIAQALRSQNIEIGAGTLTEGDTNYAIRTAGEFRSLHDIERAVITQRDGQSIRLEDIGRVYEGHRRETSLVYINGEPGVSLAIQQQSDANSVEAADNVLAQLEQINSELPPGVRLEVIFDTTQLIRDSLDTVTNQALLGAVLAVVILFFFLRSVKSTLVVAISIPTSIVSALMIMYFSGLTLNLMTLAGLALGVGLLVDNSIVILENIYRYREKGAKLRPSAILGSQEMVNAIVAATLTTVSVFLPLALFRAQLEIAGELFAGLAFTVVISLIASLLVALFLVPVLASHYFPLTTPVQKPLKGVFKRIDDRMDAMFTGLDTAYKNGLRRVLRHKLMTTLVVILMFAGGLALLPQIGFELFPAQQQDNVQLNVRMPIGTRLGRTEEIMRELEQIILEEVDSYEDIILQIGGGGMFGGGNAHTGNISITLPPFAERTQSADEIQAALRPFLDMFPGVEISFGGGGIGFGGGGLGGGRAVDIRIRTDDTDRARQVADQIVSIIEDQVPGAVDPEVNISDGLPQVDIQIDRERAYALGLNVATIGQEVRANLDGITASRYREGGNEYDIVLILDEADRTQIPDLDRIFVGNAAGIRIPLSSFASYERTTGPVTINRESQARQIRVQADLAPGAQSSEVEPQIRALVAEQVSLDDGVIVLFGGEFADLLRYGRVFIAIILVAILLVFGVMAAQFESFADPFIIFFTIPLTLIGVLAIHYAMGVNLSLFTAVGFVMLVGIVVNNGIVLVDYTNLLRRRGMELTEACVEAGGNRLRPILMTNLTTILGLVPVSFFEGEGSELIRPIGLTVIGGLTASALLTLFFVPVVYAAFNRISERVNARREERLESRFEQRVERTQTGETQLDAEDM